MLPSIEQHIEWVADCIGYLRDKGLSRIEARAEAEESWVTHVREVAGGSLRSTCSSWYIGANVPGERVWAALVLLGAFETEISFLLSDRQEVIRARSERAFAHLQRSIVADTAFPRKVAERFQGW